MKLLAEDACIGNHNIRSKQLKYLTDILAKDDYKDVNVIAFLEYLRTLNEMTNFYQAMSRF
jgi:hypothetical protein